MKERGFKFKSYDLEKLLKKEPKLPISLSLWGDFDHHFILNYDQRKVKIALLYYFDEIVAGITFYESKKFSLIPFASSPHSNLEVQFGHHYFKKQKSQRAQEQVNKIFVKELSEFIANNHLFYFRISFSPEYRDMRAWMKQGWKVTPNYTYVLNLKDIRKKTLSKHVGKKIRNIVKYAKKDLVVRGITADQFYKLYKQTYLRQKRTPPYPFSFFKKLFTIKGTFFYGAFDKTKLVSGVIFKELESKALYITSGSSLNSQGSNGTTLIIYNYLEKILKNKKIKELDLFGANTEKISYFKAAFEPKLLPYFVATNSKIPFL